MPLERELQTTQGSDWGGRSSLGPLAASQEYEGKKERGWTSEHHQRHQCSLGTARRLATEAGEERQGVGKD